MRRAIETLIAVLFLAGLGVICYAIGRHEYARELKRRQAVQEFIVRDYEENVRDSYVRPRPIRKRPTPLP